PACPSMGRDPDLPGVVNPFRAPVATRRLHRRRGRRRWPNRAPRCAADRPRLSLPPSRFPHGTAERNCPDRYPAADPPGSCQQIPVSMGWERSTFEFVKSCSASYELLADGIGKIESRGSAAMLATL